MRRARTPGRSPPPTSSSCTSSRRTPPPRRTPRSSSSGSTPTATTRPRRSTTCRCRTNWSSRSRRTGRDRQSKRLNSSPYCPPLYPHYAPPITAAARAEWANSKDVYLVMTHAPGENSCPITATNFILMYKQPKNAATAKNAKEFFQWVYANGDDQAKTLDYVPLPDELVQQIEAYWSQNMAY